MNGIRLTWFGQHDVLETVSAGSVYKEFMEYGYLLAPEGAVAVNVVMWNDGDDNELYILNQDHNYDHGISSTCGATDPEYVKPVTQPTLTLVSPTLEFKDMICMVAFYTAENTEDVVEMGMITYRDKVDTWNVQTADFVIPGASYDELTDRYFSRSQGINAKYLADTVYLACYAMLTDGSYVYTNLAPYSPITYATNQLKNATNTQLKQLVAAMLNYGAKAQLYFKHNEENLANASLTAEQLTLPESFHTDMVSTVPAVSDEKQGRFATNKGFSVRKPAITFEGALHQLLLYPPICTR